MSTQAIELQQKRAADDSKKKDGRSVTSAEAAPSSVGSLPFASAHPSSPLSLSLLLSKLGQFEKLNDYFRHYLSTHLESRQAWYLLSLSLLSSGRQEASFLSLRECLKRGEDVPSLLLAAKLSLNLCKWKESVDYSSRALRKCKAQIAARAQQAAIEAQLSSSSDAASNTDALSPNTLSNLVSQVEEARAIAEGKQDVPVVSGALDTDGTNGFVSQSSRSAAVANSELLTCQILFGVACSQYAYHVSTFSNRKSLQKRALHALENAYKAELTSGSSESNNSNAATSNVQGAVTNKKLLFALACLYADIRDINRSLHMVKRVLQVDRSDVLAWNLLALLLTSQKKYQSALACCDSGIGIVADAAVNAANLSAFSPSSSSSQSSPLPAGWVLILTKARIQAQLNQFDDAVASLSEAVQILFEPNAVHFKPISSSSSSASSSATNAPSATSANAAAAVAAAALSGANKQRPTFRPLRREEKPVNAKGGNDDGVVAPSIAISGQPEVVSAQVETLLALAKIYASQHASQVLAFSGASSVPAGGFTGTSASLAPLAVSNVKPDDSLLGDAFDCVHAARDLLQAVEATPSFSSALSIGLPSVHCALGALQAQCGNYALATRHYESALVLEATHPDSLLGLARVEKAKGSAQGNAVLAYGNLINILQVDATNHEAWYEMGLILQQEGKASAAVEHFITSLELEKTAPIVSFQSIPRRFV